jgi:spore maturation protein CgeB
MKILIIGSDYIWSIEKKYANELNKLGHSVTLIPIQNWFYDYYFKSLINKIKFRLGLSLILNQIQTRVLNFIYYKHFDIIWVFKGMELLPETIVELKKHTVKLINFNPDNPFIFSGRGSGNKNITKTIRLYDHHFTYDKAVYSKIINDYGIKCSIVPFGYDPDVIPSYDFEKLDEILAVCFIGNPDSYRKKIIIEILNKGLSVHIYGNGWEKYINHSNLIVNEPLYGKSYFEIILKYRVQINMMRMHNIDSHNMRSMEIPGCGGVMLAPRTIDHEKFFVENQEAFFYTDINDLVQKTKYILSLPRNTIINIRHSARRKVHDKFSYKILTNLFLQ